MELNRSTAIVTGANKGIGKAITEKLLANGSKVTGWSRGNNDINHIDFNHISVDISKEMEVKTAMERSIDHLDGNLDILINNAGIGIFKFFDELTMDDFKQMMEINVYGTFYTTQLAMPWLKANEGGHIINLSSIAGLQGIKEATGYSASKFAIRGFSEALYREVKKYKVKVTCIYPGSVNTGFFDQYPGMKANPTFIDPNDIADSIVHLLSSPPNYCPSELVIRPMNPKY